MRFTILLISTLISTCSFACDEYSKVYPKIDISTAIASLSVDEIKKILEINMSYTELPKEFAAEITGLPGFMPLVEKGIIDYRTCSKVNKYELSELGEEIYKIIIEQAANAIYKKYNP